MVKCIKPSRNAPAHRLRHHTREARDRMGKEDAPCPPGASNGIASTKVVDDWGQQSQSEPIEYCPCKVMHRRKNIGLARRRTRKPDCFRERRRRSNTRYRRPVGANTDELRVIAQTWPDRIRAAKGRPCWSAILRFNPSCQRFTPADFDRALFPVLQQLDPATLGQHRGEQVCAFRSGPQSLW